MDGAQRCRQYVDDVLSGEIVAPKTIIQACERFRADLTDDRFTFDDRAARVAVANIERLKHAKGRWQGQALTLEPWQCFLIGSLFGWKRVATGKRRFRYAYAQVPRKNGKTLTAIGVAINLFCADMEKGAEVYLGAKGQEHAKDLLFAPTKFIVESSPELQERFGIEINAASLVIPANFSVLKTVIRKPDDGYNPHCAVVDEYHEHETDDQWSTFDTGMGSREQPLLLTITTAGSSIGGPCHEYRNECIKILDGTVPGDSTFVLIYEPDEDDAWDDPATLRKVNPNIGVSVSEDYLLDQLEQARRSAAKQSAFRTKHLNQWVGARTAWMNMVAWQRQKTRVTLDQFRGMPCQIAIDLASKIDLAAIAVTFRVGGKFTAFAECFAPEAAIEQNDRYRKLHLNGHLTATPGSATDYGWIEERLKELLANHDVQSIAYDPYQAQYLAQRLQNEGVEVIEYRQTVPNMSEPMKELEGAVVSGNFEHDGNPALTWCIGNVMARRDEKDNVYPTKDSKDSPNKIDAAVALIMSMGLWLQEPDETSYLETEELVII